METVSQSESLLSRGEFVTKQICNSGGATIKLVINLFICLFVFISDVKPQKRVIEVKRVSASVLKEHLNVTKAGKTIRSRSSIMSMPHFDMLMLQILLQCLFYSKYHIMSVI